MLRAQIRSIAGDIQSGTLLPAIGAFRRGFLAAGFLALAAISLSCSDTGQTASASRSYQPGQPAAQHLTPHAASGAASPIRSNIGFRSSKLFTEHFTKHGAEFGNVTKQQYLRLAQTLRDEPVGGNVEEIRRPDGTTSRYDRASGSFIAFNANGTIRTFFKPNNGEAYFR